MTKTELACCISIMSQLVGCKSNLQAQIIDALVAEFHGRGVQIKGKYQADDMYRDCPNPTFDLYNFMYRAKP